MTCRYRIFWASTDGERKGSAHIEADDSACALGSLIDLAEVDFDDVVFLILPEDVRDNDAALSLRRALLRAFDEGDDR